MAAPKRVHFRRKVISHGPIITDHPYGPRLEALLECGHSESLYILDEKAVDVTSGTWQGGRWTKYTADPADPGCEIYCHKCGSDDYAAQLISRPLAKAERFTTRDELMVAHPTAKWHEYGPVHRHGDKFFVVVYFGQHEWAAINVDDVREAYDDPGWLGTEMGFAFIPEDEVQATIDSGLKNSELIGPPQREGKPITGDSLLFADKKEIQEYLGPDDPISKALLKRTID